MPHPEKPPTTDAALAATMVFWGLSFVATKVATESIPTFTLVFTRFFLAALIIAIIPVAVVLVMAYSAARGTHRQNQHQRYYPLFWGNRFAGGR